MKKIALSLLGALLLFGQCQEPNKENMEKESPRSYKTEDPHSFANPSMAKMKHLELFLTVDFEAKILKGKAKIHFDNQGSEKLFLDTRGLTIEKVTIGDREAPFVLHEEMPHLGSALEVDIDAFTKAVTVEYQTSPEAPALQWLSPQQTSGKRSPFLFTQSQAILARSWIPCQDSPGIRFTYEAEVKVPPTLLALMSAENPQSKNPKGVYQFKMEQPVPAYLMALSVGDLAFRPIGERTGVYAEANLLEKSAYEFADMEKMLVAAEKLYGPYQWGRYDVLVLPPSFPFGGMENPRLTFATPTILAGDRSLVSLIAHELAHSWSGNLVTNATWNDFWINEGFTVYFEYRIMEEIYGKDVYQMLALISYQDLQETLENMDYGDDTKLKLNLSGRDPDEGVSSIAYDKGFYFLKLIEQTVGREKWDNFLQEYFQEFAFKTVTTEQFLDYLKTHLLEEVPSAWEEINVEKWVYGPGLPDNCPQIPSPRFEIAAQEAGRFAEGTAATALQTRNWMYQEWLYFLRQLPDSLTTTQMAALDNAFGLSRTGNNEVLFQWLLLAVKYEYQPAYDELSRFLQNVGRRKFVAPLYKAMARNENLKSMAERIYRQARPNYHYVTTSTVDETLAWPSP